MGTITKGAAMCFEKFGLVLKLIGSSNTLQRAERGDMEFYLYFDGLTLYLAKVFPDCHRQTVAVFQS